MSHIHMFFNFIRANCKRLLHYLPSTFVSLLLLLLLTGTAGFYLSRHLYKENVFSAISIGYYLPQDDNLDLNQLGIGMLQDLEGMEETVQLVQVNSVEEGYNMLASHEILYLIIVPEQFFSGIMDSTNVPLDIVVYDNSSISSYIINELFMSYAGLLGTAVPLRRCDPGFRRSRPAGQAGGAGRADGGVCARAGEYGPALSVSGIPLRTGLKKRQNGVTIAE